QLQQCLANLASEQPTGCPTLEGEIALMVGVLLASGLPVTTVDTIKSEIQAVVAMNRKLQLPGIVGGGEALKGSGSAELTGGSYRGGQSAGPLVSSSIPPTM